MKDKIINFFFDEEEKDLIEDYSRLLKVFIASAVLTFILIII